MDLETENRIASILLREAAELRRQAEKDGVRAYLEKPNVRFRPNSRFLTATVLGVQQANKAVETNEMWNLRKKEIELDEKLKRKSREESSSGQSEQNNRYVGKRCTSVDKNVTSHLSSSSSSRTRDKRWQSEDADEEGLSDVEAFLQSRVKRGRGSVGPRMDETSPCLPATELSRTLYTENGKLALQPKRSPQLRHETDSSSEVDCAHRKRKEHKHKLKKKHKSKGKKRDRKKRREEKKRKHSRV